MIFYFTDNDYETLFSIVAYIYTDKYEESRLLKRILFESLMLV